jgi:hypothetical protein
MQQIAIDEIERDETSCMAQVAFAAHGRAAHIHAHMAGCSGDELFFFSGIGIVNF